MLCLLVIRHVLPNVQPVVPKIRLALLQHIMSALYQLATTQAIVLVLRGVSKMKFNVVKIVFLSVFILMNCMYSQEKNSSPPALVLLYNSISSSSTSTSSSSVTLCENIKTFNFSTGVPSCWTSSWVSTTSFCPSSGTTPCLVSSSIGNNSFVNAQFRATTGSGSITFSRRVSSETTFDLCSFKIDGVSPSSEGSGVAGTFDTSYSYSVSAGTHTFLWTYTKDSSTSGGSDQCAIDNVVIP